jgi:cell division protease FtsH
VGGTGAKDSGSADGTAATVVARTTAADARAYDALRRRRRSEKRKSKGFGALRAQAAAANFGFAEETPKPRQLPPPHALAARLLLAAAVDAAPGLADAVLGRAPVVVVVDVPDAAVLTSLQTWWADVLAPGVEGASARHLSDDTPPAKCGMVDFFVTETPKPSRKAEHALAATLALHLGVPIVAFSPDARSHLPEILVATADHRLVVGALVPDVVRAVIGTVTGRICRAAIDPAICGRLGILDLSAAIRPGIAPSDCIARMKRIAAARVRERDARDLRLDDIHGMDDAVAWARSAIADLDSWRRSELGWSSVDHSCLLVGPPGTFKSTLAQVVSRELSMPLVVGSFAKWQAAGHLGDFLKSMKSDFAEIRRTGGVILIDELDSFAVRGSAGGRRDIDTYLVACVNAILEETDALATNEGVLLIATTNRVDSIDPALLRAGRFNRIIHVALPDADALAGMLRVRLGADLAGVDLRAFAAQAAGMTGADIERAVEDARRFARRDGVELAAAHLWRALGDYDLPAGLRRRVAVHEAGHLLAEVALQGPVGVAAAVTRRLDAPGRVVRRDLRRADEGTFAFFFDRIRIDLAGRAAEEVLLGTVSDGAGSTNPRSDLSRATAAALHVVSTSGLDGPRPLLVLPDRGLFPDREVVAAADALLSRAAESVRLLLLANRPALEEIARRLERDGSLDGAEAEAILCADRDGAAKDPRAKKSP